MKIILNIYDHGEFMHGKYFQAQELDVDMFSLLVYPLRSRGKDGHFADAQIVSG